MRYNHIFLFNLILFVNSQVFSQDSVQIIWKDISPAIIEHSTERSFTPDHFRSLKVDFEALKAQLLKAPMENSTEADKQQIILNIPNPKGASEEFGIIESPVMHPELGAKYPFIRTYTARSLTNPLHTARLDFTQWGFHAMVISPDGWYFIEPFYQGNVNDYICYFKKDSNQKVPFECSFREGGADSGIDIPGSNGLERSSGSQLKTYRLALASTKEYTNFHGGTVSGALSAMVTSVNRVNGVYELEVAVRMVLIANNNLLISTNTSGYAYTNGSGSTMLGENQSNIDAVIGSANYDIGHVFSTGGGGVAYLGSVCGGSKAGGVTGQSSPVGDNFDIDYVAHEIGHQFGGSHTFNSVTGNCGGVNRSASSAYEPGSGTTIMAYAGICGADNIQPHSDPIFHSRSYDQIQTFITTGNGNSCDVLSNTGNTPPVVNAGTNYTIPYLTAFILTGSATDADGDPLTYLWEQYDQTATGGAPNSPSGNSPIFRVFIPTTNPARTFPRIEDLVRNQQTLGEILPSYARSLSFKFTARDNRLNGGGVGNNNTSVILTVINTGTAFAVTSPNSNVTWTGLTSQNVSWNVSSTSASPINCASVNILLSIDSGYTFPYTLIANTPNDGSQLVSIPNIAGNKNRIKVESVGNVFFDMSDINFTIAAGSGVLTDISTSPLVSNSLCAGAALNVSFIANGIPNSGNNYTVQLSNSSGSFTSGVTNIGSLLNSTVSSGTIAAIIPGGTISGSTYKIRVISSNPAVDGTDNGSNITISNPPLFPGLVSGLSIVCQSQTGVVYAVSPITNATGYNWTLPSGASITAGSNTNSITVSFSALAVSGSVSVSGTNTACGTGPASSLFSVTVNSLPGSSGSISGPVIVCQSSSGNAYSIASVPNASSYFWVLPAGASITSGSGTNSILVSYSASAVSGIISVNGVNSCGSGSVANLSVNVNVSPAPALISSADPLELCPGYDALLSFTAASGVNYQWKKNSLDIPGETNASYAAIVGGTYNVSSLLAPLAPQSFSNTSSVSIPDNDCNGASSTITVIGYSSSVSTSGITIQLNITHTYLGDLVLMLESPDGKIIGLSNRVGGSGDNYVNTIFSDAGSGQIPSSGVPFTNTYKPWTSLFNVCVQTTATTFSAIGSGSFNPNGIWKLWVYDRAGIDVGTIDNWTINIPGSLAGTCESISNSIVITEIPPVLISNFSPSSGISGTSVIISGGDFSTTNGVLFNGLPAIFTIDNNTQITAIVPAGATTGFIEIVSACGSVFSSTNFISVSPDLTVHLTVFIEGFYRGSGQMIAVLSGSFCDTIEVSLADPNPPHSLLYSVKGTIDLTGTGDFTFIGAGQNEYYYIVVKHRNSLEIWTEDSVSFFISTVNYNFTNVAGRAYGANQISVGGGKFAMYSGDINQDGIIDSADVVLMENGIQSFLYGYYSSDLNGDGIVENADYSVLDNNSSGVISVSKP